MSKKILAVASAGGHWVQLMRLLPAFSEFDVHFMTTKTGYSSELNTTVYVVKDASLWDKGALLLMFVQVFWVTIRLRPHVVITTGAAPGFAAIIFGRFFGAKTIWIDSIANSEELSGSGKKVRKWAHVWLTQWEHLARADGPIYWGSVL